MSDDALVKNASDAKQVQAAGPKLKLKERQAREEIGAVMSTRAGRKWIWKMLEWCNVFGPTFRIDPHQSAYAEGARLAGLEILKHVTTLGPEIYLLMQKESLDDKERGL